MGLPSKRRTKTSKKERASHFALKTQQLDKCPKCGKPVMPHHACSKCGSYKGKEVVSIKAKTKTLRQREKARKAEAKDKAKK
jgi:large subunit ribosomal protein L32